ncbi:MAG: cytochrome [Segetibacter sp.]|nr:cytochrome [Segetibacter sp.]
MIDRYSYPDSIKFRKDFSYDKVVPTFVSNNIGGTDEIARWVLDLNDTLYKDEQHAPYLYTAIANRLTGNKNPGNSQSPVLIKTDGLIYTANSVLQYYEQHCLSSKKLLPEEPATKKEVLDLYNLFTNEFEDHVNKYVYSQLLAHPPIARRLFTKGVPINEKLTYSIKYASISGALSKEYQLNESKPGECIAFIRKIFEHVNERLSDGRKYLAGSALTMADIAFASVAAPLILPEEFGGVVPRIQQLPEEYRKLVIELRETRAGQFILDLYQEDRPHKRSQYNIPKEPNILGLIAEKLKLSLSAGKSNIFYFLQKRYPVLRLGPLKLMTVNKFDLVVELLSRDLDFTVEEINSKKMADQKGAFFLGWDRNNPQFDRERNLVRSVTQKDDLELIRSFVRTTADEIIANAQDYGKLDVADTLSYPVLIRLLDFYFGVPSPSEDKMKRWCRALFFDLFLNFMNNATKHQKAVDASLERKEWILELIEDRKQALKDGKTLPDNILNRLIILQQQPGNEWVDDDVLQRNLGGLLTGILETTNKSVMLVLDELLNRPEILKGAVKVAGERDMKKMYGYVAEALRFNPAQPGVIRFSENKQVLKGKGDKTYTIPAKTKVLALTAAAMFDPEAFPDPKKFNPQRDAVYMNYGYGLHECYGKYINAVTISELVAAVLRLKNVRRVAGRAGAGTGLKQGPFPTNFVVAFDQDDFE